MHININQLYRLDVCMAGTTQSVSTKAAIDLQQVGDPVSAIRFIGAVFEVVFRLQCH